MRGNLLKTGVFSATGLLTVMLGPITNAIPIYPKVAGKYLPTQ